jgi:hypothetical protein
MGETRKVIFSSSQQGVAPLIDEATPLNRGDARRADEDSVGPRGPGDAERAAVFVVSTCSTRFITATGGRFQ